MNWFRNLLGRLAARPTAAPEQRSRILTVQVRGPALDAVTARVRQTSAADEVAVVRYGMAFYHLVTDEVARGREIHSVDPRTGESLVLIPWPTWRSRMAKPLESEGKPKDYDSYLYVKALVSVEGRLTFEYKLRGLPTHREGYSENVSGWSDADVTKLTRTYLELKPDEKVEVVRQ